MGVPIQISHMEIAGESVEFNHWESDCDGERERTFNQHTDLGIPNSSLQCPNSNPNQQFCSSAEAVGGEL